MTSKDAKTYDKNCEHCKNPAPAMRSPSAADLTNNSNLLVDIKLHKGAAEKAETLSCQAAMLQQAAI